MYIPTEEDVSWAHQMVSLILENGILAYPSTGLIYRVSHYRKKLTLVNPAQLGDPASLVVHLRTRVVFEVIGYKVFDSTEDSEPPFG